MSGRDEIRAKKIGTRVRRWRSINNMTQKELGELIHVSPSSISRLESGEEMVGVFTIMDIAEALNISVGSLLEDEKECDRFDVTGLNGVAKRVEQFEAGKRIRLVNAIENLLDSIR